MHAQAYLIVVDDVNFPVVFNDFFYCVSSKMSVIIFFCSVIISPAL